MSDTAGEDHGTVEGPAQTPWLDLVISLLLAAIGIFAIVVGISLGVDPAKVTSSGLAAVVFGAFLAIPSGLVALKSGRALIRARTSGADRDEPDTGARSWRPAAMFGLLVVYLLIMDIVGYPIATGLFTAGIMLEFRWPIRKVLIGAIGITAVTTIIFTMVIHVPLPTGILL